MSTRQGNLKDYQGNKIAPNTLTSAVYDAAKSQALSHTLRDTPDRNALGYPAFSTVTAYSAGDIVFYNNTLWKFTSNHTAGAWNAAEVEAVDLKTLIDALASLGVDLKLALGYSAEGTPIVITAGETGKYVKCADRAAVSNANFNISAPFDVEACSELLIETGYNPSDNDHAALDISVIAIFEQMERVRTVQKKDGSNNPLYYVVVVDPETGTETVTTEETTVNTGYPVWIQETYTETRYLPNNEDRFVKIPDSGYYVANIPQSCKCVISYKPGVSNMTVRVLKYGALANLTSQLYGIHEHRTMVEAMIQVEARLKALEESSHRLGNATAGIVDAMEYRVKMYPQVLRAAGVPAAETRPVNIPDSLPWDGIPAFVGQEYLDTTNKKVYKAFGVNAVSDWVALN